MTATLPDVDEDQSWKLKGRCLGVDPGVFFPEFSEQGEEAKAICNGGCPVRDECLEYALVHETFGVWGGVSERGRRRIRRQRRRGST